MVATNVTFVGAGEGIKEGATEMDGVNVGEGVSCTYHTQFTYPKYFRLSQKVSLVIL
jgi:hypothetical protein